MPPTAAMYRGRFAPSPTGPLHLGSLIAALASFLDARHAGGRWLLRMDDLDPPREEAGAAAGILDSLRCHGLHWDEPVLYQSTRGAAYDAALARLAQGGHLFRCRCSRAKLQPDGACGGNCRGLQASIVEPCALRVTVPVATEIRFTDQLQGLQRATLGDGPADFIVRRRDGLYAYQLAVVVDDDAQHITHVVRGSDLLDSTPRQILLQRLLHIATPAYCHLPVITTRQGQKFSKQNHAPALVDTEASLNLRRALRFLRQPEPPLSRASIEAILEHAIRHWTPQRLPTSATIPATSLGLDT